MLDKLWITITGNKDKETFIQRCNMWKRNYLPSQNVYLFLIITNILFWIRAVIVIVFSSVRKWPLSSPVMVVCFTCESVDIIVSCFVFYLTFVVLLVISILSFLTPIFYICLYWTLVKQELHSILEYLISFLFFCGVHVAQYLVFCVVLCVL